MSPGPMAAFEALDLMEGVGVLSRSFSEILAGVDVTFSGNAEEAICMREEGQQGSKVEDLCRKLEAVATQR